MCITISKDGDFFNCIRSCGFSSPTLSPPNIFHCIILDGILNLETRKEALEIACLAIRSKQSIILCKYATDLSEVWDKLRVSPN